ncbi:MAG: hypothetical protein GYA34_09275 [Chloroflexi bacterium]|nr:hypothetical protein [Chloroflexota bacterium]
MTDIEIIKTKAMLPQALKKIPPEKIVEDVNSLEIVSLLNGQTVKCSREVVVKIINKIKQL